MKQSYPSEIAAFLRGRSFVTAYGLTHVWQAQARGRFYLPLMRHPFCRYDYQLIEDRPFERYGLEQQAEMVRHCFLADRSKPIGPLTDRSFLPFNGS